MPLVLVTGAPNSGKSGLAYDRLREALAASRPCALLVPSLPEAERASSEFVRSVPLGLDILTFDRYLHDRWMAEGDGRRIVTSGQRAALMARALRQQGLDHALASSTGALRLATRLAQTSGTRIPSDGQPSDEAASLIAVVGRYQLSLQDHGLVEPREAFGALVVRHPPHELVVVHRFSDLSEYQAGYLERLSAAGVDVLVTLPWRRGSAATEAVQPLVERLSAIGTHAVAASSAYATRPALVEFADHLFAPGAEPLVAPSDISFVLCQDSETEVARIADEVLNAVRAGTPAEQIAVVYRNPWPRAVVLRRALAERGISCDVDTTRPLRSLPLTRALLDLMRFLLAGRREDLLSWLRSPFSGMPSRDSTALESEWRRDRQSVPTALARSVASKSAESRKMLSVAQDLVGGTPGLSWAKSFDTLMGLALAAAHPHGVGPGSASGLEDSQAIKGLSSLVADVCRLEIADLRLEDFLAAVDQERVGPGRLERPGHVQIAGIDRVRSRRFAVVVLGGLTADEFPQVDSDDPLQCGAVGEAASRLGIQADPLRDARERADLLAVVTRARERLVLLTHELSGDGEPIAPSPFWYEMIDLYASRAEEEPHPDFVELVGPAPRASGSEPRHLKARLAGKSGPPFDNAPDVFSAASLEKHVACPAQWFHDRLLDPFGPDAEFGALEGGRLAHEVLRATLSGLLRTGRSRVTHECLEDARRLAADAFESACRAAPLPAGVDELDRVEDLRAKIDAFLRAEADFAPRLRPTELEFAFGFSDDDPPVDIGGLRLRGRIDRIDDGEGVLLVTDYKSHDMAPYSAFERLGLLQLQLYVAALRSRGMPVGGAVYRSLRTGRLSGFYLAEAFSAEELPGAKALTDEEFEQTISAAVNVAAEAADGIRSGSFEPRPRQDACRYCRLSPICEERR